MMGCQSGHLVRGKLSLQTSSRLVRLLRSTSRASSPRPFTSSSCQHCLQTSCTARHTSSSLLLVERRPSTWGCSRLSTSCQASSSSPHAAVIEKAERKASSQQGQLVPLPTTDESPELDRIRHSVSTDHCSSLQHLHASEQGSWQRL